MKNEKIVGSWNKIEPERTTQARMLGNILDQVHSGKRQKGTISNMVKKSNWKILAPITACLIIAAVLAVPFFNRSVDTDDGLTLNLSNGNVSVCYIDKLPNLPSVSNLLLYLTEDELLHEYDTDIFSGTIKEIRNIEIDFNGHTDYRAFAKIEVADVFRGDIKSGDVVPVLLPAPINVEGLWVEDTDVISHMAIGTNGIFMPLKYDESHYREEAGTKLYYVDIAKYGLLDGERYVFLDTPEGLVFARWAYESITNATKLDEIKQYINSMLGR